MTSEALGAYMNHRQLSWSLRCRRCRHRGIGSAHPTQNIPTRCNRKIRLNIFHRFPDIFYQYPFRGKQRLRCQDAREERGLQSRRLVF